MKEYIGPTNYPHLREMLDPSIAALPDAEIEALFEEAFGEGVTPAEYEEFFGSLGKAVTKLAQKAAPVVSTAVSGALRGAGSGAALGPWGIIGGALTGATGATLARHGPRGARGIGAAINSVVGTAGRLSGPGGLATNLLSTGAQALGRQSPAAGQLLGVLGHPATRQAMSALARGSNPRIPAGLAGLPVPASAFASLLRSLAREAEAEADPWPESAADAYLADVSGEYVVDPQDDVERAGRLLQLLNETALEEWESDESDEEDDEADGEAYESEAYEGEADDDAEEWAWAVA